MGTSIRGHIAKTIIKAVSNANPERVKDPAKKILLLDALKTRRACCGFKRELFITPNGTKYEIHSKKGSKKNGNVFLYLHGGAYLYGLISLYTSHAKEWSKITNGGEVFFIDYRCARPGKNLWPSQLDEAYDLWNHMINELGYKEENIVVGGDSAGGNLTLALLLKLRDEGRKMPRTAFCISPWADMTGLGDSYTFNYALDDLFGNSKGKYTSELREKFMDCNVFTYCIGADRFNPLVSPVYGDYHDFPPMMFTVGSHEILLSDTMTIYNNLKKNNVPVEISVGKEMFHIYPFFAWFIPEAKKSWKELMKFIEKQFK